MRRKDRSFLPRELLKKKIDDEGRRSGRKRSERGRS
jgi:hypothetical protein